MGFWNTNWGDVAGGLGLLLTVCTLWVATKARDAAERARAKLLAVDTLADLVAARTGLEEIRRPHRAGGRNWERLLERYSVVRERLRIVLSTTPALEGRYKAALQSAVHNVGVMETTVERLGLHGGPMPNFVAFDQTVSGCIMDLNDVMSAIRLREGVQWS